MVPVSASAVAANRASALPPTAPRAPPLHPAFPRAPCRYPFQSNPVPSTRHRAPHIPLRCISKLLPSQMGNRPASPASAQFPSSPRPSARSLEYSWAIRLQRVPAVASAGALGSATPPLPPASPHSARRCTCPAPRRFLEASVHRMTASARPAALVVFRLKGL